MLTLEVSLYGVIAAGEDLGRDAGQWLARSRTWFTAIVAVATVLRQ